MLNGYSERALRLTPNGNVHVRVLDGCCLGDGC